MKTQRICKETEQFVIKIQKVPMNQCRRNRGYRGCSRIP